ncbi:hypothetical protein MKX01_035894 [Papaver californicum]|nr:hypothetical protein MKX01_035894 [Papaver californicum]
MLMMRVPSASLASSSPLSSSPNSSSSFFSHPIINVNLKLISKKNKRTTFSSSFTTTSTTSSGGLTWSNRIGHSLRCFSALTPGLKETLDKVVTADKVVLFMKGTKDFPQCGFSNTVVSILRSLNVPFETHNILENELLRQALKEYSNWPTFPQLYIDGEFFGGCDITVESYKSGELQEILEKAMCS